MSLQALMRPIATGITSRAPVFLFRRHLKVSTRDGLNFTHCGVLPFLQYRINKVLNEQKVNVAPTPVQNSILEVMNSGRSLVVKDNLQSGKSFAMLVYAINQQLNGWKNGSKPGSVASCIVVPNNTLLVKYKEWSEGLIQELDPNCCPEVRDGAVSTVPLKITVVDDAMNTLSLSTDSSAGNDISPQIVIANSKSFNRILTGESALNLDFSGCKFIGVDEATFIFNSTHSAASSPNMVKVGKKGRLELAWTKSMKLLRARQLAAAKGSDSKRNPLQYCFIFHSQHPFQRAYKELMSGSATSITVPAGVQYDRLLSKLSLDDETEVVSRSIRYTNEELEYVKTQPVVVKIDDFDNKPFYTVEPGAVPEKRIDMAVARCVKEKNRVVIKPVDPLTGSPSRSEIFSEIENGSRATLKNSYSSWLRSRFKAELTRNASRSRKAQLYQILKGSIRTFRKSFPENKDPILIVLPPFHDLLSPAMKFNNSKASDRIVVYGGVDFINELKMPESAASGSAEAEHPFINCPSTHIRDFFIDERQKGDITYNLLIPSSELPGTDISGVKNLIVLDTVMDPSLATADCYNTTEKDLTFGVAGVTSPFTSLFYYYVSKLQLDQDSQKRNILYVTDECYSKVPESTLQETLLFNDMNALVNYK